MAEFVVLLPLLLVILMGCLDLGRAFAVWVCLTNGTREGARLASVQAPVNDERRNQIADLTKHYVLAEGWSADALTVDISPGVSAVKDGQPVAVGASYQLELVTLMLFGGAPVTITARTEMQVLAGESTS